MWYLYNQIIAKCKPILFAFFTLFPIYLNAQSGFLPSKKEIEALKSRKLLVMIEKPTKFKLKMLSIASDPVLINQYQEDLALFNANIQLVAQKWWPYNKEDIQYKTLDELNEIKRSRSKEFVVLSIYSARASTYGAGKVYANGLAWSKDIKEDVIDGDIINPKPNDAHTVVNISLIESFGSTSLYEECMVDVFPTMSSLILSMYEIKRFFDLLEDPKKTRPKVFIDQMVDKNISKLKDKTLLIRKEWLDKNLTEETIKNFYPYKYEVCTKSKMDEIIVSQNNEYACGIILPYIFSGNNINAIIYLTSIVDISNGDLLFMINPYSVSLLNSRNRFTSKTLETIVNRLKANE